MKRIFYLLFSLIFSLFFFSSCDKDNVDEADNNLNEQKDSDESEDIIVDVSISPLNFWISSDSTVEVTADSQYYGYKPITIPTKVKLKDKVYNVTGIGSSAFVHSREISSINIPKSITYIDTDFSGAGRECECRFTSINVAPDNPNFTSVDGVLYDKDMKELMRVPTAKTGVFVVPDGVTSISSGAFGNCCGITGIKLPSSVTSIGSWTFYDCSLESIEIPYGVTSIEDNAFSGCESLESINVDANNLNYTSFDGILYNKKKTEIIEVPEGIKGKVTVPESVTEIGGYAFSYRKSLESVMIMEGVTGIEHNAFFGCSSLTSITIPESVTEIHKCAFSDCSSLTSITIPKSITYIAPEEFWDCSSLTSITIPSSVTEIGEGAFFGCSSLTSITIPESVTSIHDKAFYGCDNLDVVIENLEVNVRFFDHHQKETTMEETLAGVKSVTFIK